MRFLISISAAMWIWSAAAAAEPTSYTLGVKLVNNVATGTPQAELKGSLVAADGIKIAVTCSDGADCKQVAVNATAVSNGKKLAIPSKPAATASAATFAIPANAKLTVVYKVDQGQPPELLPAAVTVTATAPSPAPEEQGGAAGPKPGDKPKPGDPPKPQDVVPPPAAATPQQLARTTCQHMRLAPAADQVFVTPLGATLTPLPDHFAETDTLTVTVIGDKRLLDSLIVDRKSSIRTDYGRVLGEDQLPKGGNFFGQALEAPDLKPCGQKSFTVSSFAAGTGEVDIVAATDTDQVTLGAFKFPVDPVYIGMYSIGAVWTPLIDPSFGVATRNGTQVIVQSEQGSRRMGYALMFTPFLWDGLQRDVRRPINADKLWHYINPSVGFLLNDPVNNALVGVTLDLQSCILLTGGVLFSHVTELDGAKPGDAFSGMASDIPTHKRWKKDWFVGVSVDVRIGVKLLRTVLGTAGGA
jgi:hypothetical protein